MQERVAILGAGESGVGAAILAKSKGYDVFVSDLGEVKRKYQKILDEHSINWESGKHSEKAILNADLLIKSPGIPKSASIVRQADEQGIPITGEIEFAGKFTKGIKICITGSNGKTTTTLLIYDMLKRAGLDVCLAGNVGQSFAGELAKGDHEYFVIELSSFQLDDIAHFKPEIAVLLNITPDHLDRYNNSLTEYARSKFRIAMNQNASDAFIFWKEDPVILKGLAKNTVRAKKYPFSESPLDKGEEGAFIKENHLTINIKNQLFDMSIQDLALQGKHNIFNSMAAGVAARILDLRKEIVRDSLTHFEQIEHRLERVARVNGITFINDSKATNVNSAWYALESQDAPIIWIAGGVDKGNKYRNLAPIVSEKVKVLICLGEDNEKLIRAFKNKVDAVIEVRSAEEAVKKAYDLGLPGDTVLLSPACASFDLFEDYEDRGQKFKKAVKKL